MKGGGRGPGWRGREGREAGGVRGRREAGRADAPGEGAGQEGEGEREREKCRGCSGGGGGSSGSGGGGGGSAPTRSSLRAPPSSRGESLRLRPGSGRTTPATRAPRRHRAHPGAAQAPRAGKEARPGGPPPPRTRGAGSPGASVRPRPTSRPFVLSAPRRGAWGAAGLVRRRPAWGPSARFPSHFGVMGGPQGGWLQPLGGWEGGGGGCQTELGGG